MMPATLGILCCHNFVAEVGASVAAEGWSDVVVAEFPARCGRPPLAWEELRPLLPAGCGQLLLLGRACLGGLGEPPADFPPTRSVAVAQCFHLVAGEQLVDAAIAGGAYLITPSWLADWRGQLRAMGFAPEQAGGFFGDFARELVLLDTGLDAATGARAAELEVVAGLPLRRIGVGLDYTRRRLAGLVLEWRLEQARHALREQQRQHARELADQVAAMDMLGRLARAQQEAEAIAVIDDLFRMLFAPAALYYLRLENDVPTGAAAIPAEPLEAMRALAGEYALSPDGRGFLLRIGHGDAGLGVIAVEGLAFPQYRERYLNMALALSGVCGLAIANARNRRRLVEAEKMAALGILVAGVAHEINTPLGVGVAAASTLQQQSRQLAGRFDARSMTQSDLRHYLDTAAASTGLLLQNLERIGHLIDNFRQVAVGGKAPPTTHFRLRDCLDDVIRSLGDRLPAERVTISITGDRTLAVDSVFADWASIFTNLIGNSLKHGFKDRAQGRIEIGIGGDERKLRVDYRDDGVGLTAESLARIFDPFYTTDLQQGMGLGMHLVYNLVNQRMGGSIQCESPPGQGVHCRIEVPQAVPR